MAPLVLSPASLSGLRVVSKFHDDLTVNEIPSSLSTLPSLQAIQLSENEFSQLDEMVNLTSSRLESLDISNNNPSRRVPRFLFTSRSIQLFHNHFSQLDKIRNVSRLYSLDLSSNDLFGPFSTSILQLNTLFVLHFSSNQFNGSVQLNKLLEVKSLTELDLSCINLKLM
ncbi:hypothetical protein JHK87_006241 [Glycine soja]|nr:hypothetical protein JHK87_006241 [Glycine soja]